ncbi:MAG: DUF3568 family protein [Planctomycetaceae bacterium]|nr:DUF3568 family protein [Planctomycetaceae bacterium]
MRIHMLLVIAALAVAGCDKKETAKVTPATRDLGTGLNTVEKTYARAPADMVPVVQRTLQELELKIDSEKYDNLGGETVALRATGQKVTVGIKGLDSRSCGVSIRVEPGDRNLANLIHGRIAEHLLPAGERTRQP